MRSEWLPKISNLISTIEIQNCFTIQYNNKSFAKKDSFCSKEWKVQNANFENSSTKECAVDQMRVLEMMSKRKFIESRPD